MSEPTIDDMVAWLDGIRVILGEVEQSKAIRAILEQHRKPEPDVVTFVWAEKQIELEAIRAFVERVEARQNDLRWTSEGNPLAEALYAELAAMEKDAK